VALARTTSNLAPEDLLAPLPEVGRTGELPPASLTARILEAAPRVLEIEPLRLYELLTPPLCDKHPHVLLQWLRDAGILVHILPELDATFAFSQEGGRRHKDVWEHTKTVVQQSVSRPAVRWSAALHDIGKVTTRRFLPGGKVTFHGHAEEGVRMFRRGPARRIGFPREERTLIEELIRHHLRPGQYDGSWTDAAVRRFHRDMEPFLRDLLDLGRADVTSKRPGKRARCLRCISELAKRIRDLAEEDGKPKPLPAGLGNALMEGLGLPPGKHIGELRQRLQGLFEAGKLEGAREAEYYLDAVRTLGLLEGIEIRPPRGYPT
jgi:poly(A) polymerase